MFSNIVAIRTQLIQAKIAGTPSTNKKYKFQDIPNLSKNNIIVYGFEAYGADQLSVTPDGATTIPSAGIPGVTITLRDNKKQEFVYQMPAYSAVRANNGGLAIIIQPRIINLTDCYIQLTNTTGISAEQALSLNLYYDIID